MFRTSFKTKEELKKGYKGYWLWTALAIVISALVGAIIGGSVRRPGIGLVIFILMAVILSNRLNLWWHIQAAKVEILEEIRKSKKE